MSYQVSQPMFSYCQDLSGLALPTLCLPRHVLATSLEDGKGVFHSLSQLWPVVVLASFDLICQTILTQIFCTAISFITNKYHKHFMNPDFIIL